MQNYYQRPPMRSPYQNQNPAGCCQKILYRRIEKRISGSNGLRTLAEICRTIPGLQSLCSRYDFEELDKPFLGKGGCRS